MSYRSALENSTLLYVSLCNTWQSAFGGSFWLKLVDAKYWHLRELHKAEHRPLSGQDSMIKGSYFPAWQHLDVTWPTSSLRTSPLGPFLPLGRVRPKIVYMRPNDKFQKPTCS